MVGNVEAKEGLLMPSLSYEEFAIGYASRIAEAVRDAMVRQLSGEDQDIAEVNWQVQRSTASLPMEVVANVQCDFDRKALWLNVDERDGTVPGSEFETTYAAGLLFGEAAFIHVGAEQSSMTAGDLERVLGEFARRAMVSEGAK